LEEGPEHLDLKENLDVEDKEDLDMEEDPDLRENHPADTHPASIQGGAGVSNHTNNFFPPVHYQEYYSGELTFLLMWTLGHYNCNHIIL
jgi:hypothetical protein